MNNPISTTISFVKEKLANAEAGHNWFHTERVWRISKLIAETEQCNLEIVELSALLHDIADPKFHQGNEELAITIASDFLKSIAISPENIEQILFIIQYISFKNRKDIDSTKRLPIEFQIVQDADRLEAMGAIGIARAFHFGGFKNNLIYHPDILPNLNITKEEYKKSDGTTINHFYEKLLLLKDLMNTNKGKELAEERHQFMLSFLEQFHKEWNIS